MRRWVTILSVLLRAAAAVSLVKNVWVDQGCRSPSAVSIILVSSGQNPVLKIKNIFEVWDGLLMLPRNVGWPKVNHSGLKQVLKKGERGRERERNIFFYGPRGKSTSPSASRFLGEKKWKEADSPQKKKKIGNCNKIQRMLKVAACLLF